MSKDEKEEKEEVKDVQEKLVEKVDQKAADKHINGKVEKDKPEIHQRTLPTGTGIWLGLWDPSKSISSNPPEKITNSLKLTKADKKSLLIVLTIACLVRFYDLKNPPNVVFEEAVMGSFINRYFPRRFFIDYEPPLAGIVYYWIAKLVGGYQGTFEFSSGYDSYIGKPFSFIILRNFAALLGVLSVLFTYLTLKLYGLKRHSIIIGSSMVIFDNLILAEHRYISPQPILFFLFTFSIFLWKKFELQRQFSLSWYGWAILLSVVLGLISSTRLVGSYIIAYLLILNVYQSWWTGADLKVGVYKIFTNFFVRFLIFGIIPMICYAVFIMLHLNMADHSGDGDTFMPGSFQAMSLVNNERPVMAANISLGGLVTIRHLNTYSFLHSHVGNYPTGSGQQQVSLYQYRDLNNLWQVGNYIREDDKSYYHMKPTTIKSGSYIRLKHLNTNKHLHSHKIKAPVSENDWQNEVSAYGADGYPGDMHDIWRVEVLNPMVDTVNLTNNNWQALRSVVRFQHAMTGCYLFSHDTQLPGWGSDQQEVTCAINGVFENQMWIVETHYHPQYLGDKPGDWVDYTKPTIAEKLNYYTTAMIKAQKRIEHGAFWEVNIWELPLLKKGLSLYWNNNRQVFLFGNLMIWYPCLLVLVGYAGFKVVIILMTQRALKGQIELKLPNIVQLDHNIGQLVLGWSIHMIFLKYLKVHLNIIDYMPPLYYSILIFAQVWDYVTSNFALPRKYASTLAVAYLSLVVWTCWSYAPLSLGRPWIQQECLKFELNKDWGFNCYKYLPTMQDYIDMDKSLPDIVYHHVTSKPETPVQEPIGRVVKSMLDLEEFRGIQGVKPQDVELENPLVKQLLINFIRERGLQVDKAADVFTGEVAQKLDPTKLSSAESLIKKQWALITEAPTLPAGASLAHELGLSTYNAQGKPEDLSSSSDNKKSLQNSPGSGSIAGQHVINEYQASSSYNEAIGEVSEPLATKHTT